MRTFAIGAVLAVIGGLAFAGRADAQPVVIGTRGTADAGLGYYSPYPGALYSPFRPAAPTVVFSSPAFGPGFNNGVLVAPNYYYNGFTITQFNTPNVTQFNTPNVFFAPQYGYAPYGRYGYYRRW